MMSLVLIIIVRSMPDIWQVTVAGWATLIVSIGAVVLIPVGYGKWIEKMNGMGRRVKDVEDAQERAAGADIERRLEMERILNQHEELIRLVGEAKKTAEQCNDNTAQHSIELGSKVAETLAAVRTMELSVSQRLTAVETELRIRGKQG